MKPLWRWMANVYTCSLSQNKPVTSTVFVSSVVPRNISIQHRRHEIHFISVKCYCAVLADTKSQVSKNYSKN